ncbi:MAG: sulfatase [Phycisphaerae bacterium]|nr:sulfatase [Phycisphaerae bacterium]
MGRGAILLSMLLACGCASNHKVDHTTDALTNRPNVVLIVFDDLGYGDFGCTGALAWTTPNIDAIASDGVRLTDFSVSEPVCSASRASILTGRYARRVGVRGAIGPNSGAPMPSEAVTIAECLHAVGYATACFGKWHLGHQAGHRPNDQGFDHWAGILFSNDMWPLHPESPKAWPPLEWWNIDGTRTPIDSLEDQATMTGRVTDASTSFIKAHPHEPFFLYVPHPMPHVPLACSPRFRGTSRSQVGVYGDVMQELDWSVGQIMNALDAIGARDRTLVIITSDNGPWLSYGTHAGSTGGLREGKGTSFEGGIRVPCIAHGPGVARGVVCDVPMWSIDLLPTICAMTGTALPDQPIDGRNEQRVLADCTGSADRCVFTWYAGDTIEAVREGRWKLHLPHAYRSLEGRPGGQGGVPARYSDEPRTGLELYDLGQDPCESRNVAVDHPEIVERLHTAARNAERSDERAETAPTEPR